MKTLQDFNNETEDYTSLEDFVLSTKEWSEFETGTRAFRVDTFNGNNAKLVGREYVLKNMDNTDEVLEDMQAVGCGYFTTTYSVIKK